MVPLLLELPAEVLRRSRIVSRSSSPSGGSSRTSGSRTSSRRSRSTSVVTLPRHRWSSSGRTGIRELPPCARGPRRADRRARVSLHRRDLVRGPRRVVRRADVYLSMSVHEGFCAPLIEALAHGVPVVARGAGAVPETLGGAGLVLDDADYPARRGGAPRACASPSSTRSAFSTAAESASPSCGRTHSRRAFGRRSAPADRQV